MGILARLDGAGLGAVMLVGHYQGVPSTYGRSTYDFCALETAWKAKLGSTSGVVHTYQWLPGYILGLIWT